MEIVILPSDPLIVSCQWSSDHWLPVIIWTQDVTEIFNEVAKWSMSIKMTKVTKSAQTNQNLPKYTIDSSALANKVPYPFFWKYASLKFQILFCTISWQQDWANITLTSFWNSTSDTPDFTWMIDDSNKVYCMNCAQANEVFFTGLYRWMCLPIWARWHQEAQCYDEQYMARLSCTIFQSAEPPILQHSQDNVFAP